MKKTKILVIMTLVLSLLVGTMSGAGVSAEAASNIPDVKVAFINVCEGTVGNSEGKADATLIEANNEMVLVDCGTKSTYDHLKTRIQKRYKNMTGQTPDVIELKAIVITHNHSDHMGALDYIINGKINPETKKREPIDFKVGKVVYADICDRCRKNGENCKCSGTTNLKRVENAVNRVEGRVAKIVNLQPLEHKETYSHEDLKPHRIALGNTRVKVYKPISEEDYIEIDELETEAGKEINEKKHQTLWANNRSMIVRVVTSKTALSDTSKGMTALLLGDLYVNGVVAANNVYGSEIFGKDYDVCKVGHHGLRQSGFFGEKTGVSKMAEAELKAEKDKEKKKLKEKFWKNDNNKYKYASVMDAEIAYYNKYVRARNYVFNVEHNMVADESKGVIKRYNKFAVQGNLKDKSGSKSSCVEYGSVFHVDTSGKFTKKTNECIEVEKGWYIFK